jgi:hypothetical protein
LNNENYLSEEENISIVLLFSFSHQQSMDVDFDPKD